MFQVIGPKLKLRNYSERKLFWTLKCEGYFVNGTVIENLTDGTA